MAHAASDVFVTTAATSGGTFSGGNPNIFTPTSSPAVASNATIQTSLNAGIPVILNTSSAAAGNGDLVTTATISKTAGATAATLTLNAVRDLTINGTMSASVGSMPLTLTAGRAISSTAAITTGNGAVTINTVQPFALGGSLNAGTGQILLQSGSVESASSQTVTADNVQVAAGSSWKHQGTIAGNLSVAGNLSAGPVAGSLQINGTLALQSSATTIVDLAGTSQGSTYDSIDASGSVTVAGALQLNFLSGFENVIVNDHSFTVISGSSITGTFTGLPNDARIILPNELGSVKINYSDTAITLSDWQPYIRNLTWDPGTVDGGSEILTNTNTRAGRHYFRVLTQSTDIGAWRSRLTLQSGDAALYLSKTDLPTTSNSQFSSNQTGGDGFVLRDDEFAPGEEWFIMVNAAAGAQWSLFSGRAYVNELGALPFTDSNGNSQYDIGEAVTPQSAPATPMPPEGIRFYRATVPAGTPAWSLWLNGSTRDIAVSTAKVPFHDSTNYYARKQAGQMLVVPTVLGTDSNAYFLSVVAPQGESLGLDSRIQTVTDIGFQSTTTNVAVTGAPYRVFRTQVPIDQLAWDISTTAVAGNPNICVRKNNVAGEWDNDALSEAPGTTTDSVTLVPDFLTNGTWFITVYGTGNYTFTLKSGDPVITPLNFTDLKVNDQTNRAGWRYYALTDIPSQLGPLGWELLLSGQVPGTQIAIRRNKVPSRWLYRTDGNMSTPSDSNTSYMDYYGNNGFLQRPGHQADVWYVGIYTPQQPLGAFTLDTHPIVPGTVGFNGDSTAVTGLQPGKWSFQRIDVPAGVLGWDVRLKDITGGTPQMIVRRDQLPDSTDGNWMGPYESPNWPSGKSWSGRVDWTERHYDEINSSLQVGPRLVAGMGRPLEPGTYYVGVYNAAQSEAAAYTIESRGIGSGQAITVADLSPAAGSNATITNLLPREAAYFKVAIPANTPSWEFTLSPSVGEMMMVMRRGTIPDFNASNGDVQDDNSIYGSREVEMQKAGPERYLMLPRDNQDYITAGDYYIAVISEGVNPPDPGVIGTDTSSGVLTSLGALGTTDLGTASLAGITQPVNLTSAQVKSYQFTVPVGTASLEVRLDNRVGNPWMSLMSGSRIPAPGISYGINGGHYGAPAGGVDRLTEGNLITIANPPPGTYSLTLSAETDGYDEQVGSYNYPDASADLVIVASTPLPLTFNGGTAFVSGQSPTAWHYFTVTVPAGVLGWDVRLKNITGGTPQMIVRRDQLPDSTDGNWIGPYESPNWPSGKSWSGRVDWTERHYDEINSSLQVGPRLVAGMGRPLEPGTYYVGVYNSHASQAAAYTIESRGIGSGQAITVADLSPAAGSNATITNLIPREAVYFKVAIPANTPSWEFTLSPSVGEMMMAMRRGTIPDFNASNGDVQDDNSICGSREVEMQKAGPERYLMLPRDNQDYITAGYYYIAVISEGVNPPDPGVIGTDTSSGVLTSLGALGTTDLGTASLAGITQPVNLTSAQVKSYQFTVPVGTASLEVRLDNRVGNPWMSLISGNRISHPVSDYSYGFDGGQYSAPAGGVDRLTEDNLITIANPPSGTFSLTLSAKNAGYNVQTGFYDYPDASADLVIRQLPRIPLNYAASLNGNGQSHTDTRQLLDGQKSFYEVPVPATLGGQPVLGWLIKMNHLQGDTTLKVYKTWSSPNTGVTVTGNTALIVPPFLTPGDTWFVEVQGTGLTNYTITSLPITLERPAWTMPLGHNTTFGDSGNDSGGTPLPGDRGVDIGQDDWHFYAIDVPEGNAGLLRTELQAINGDPNLYIREDGVPTTDHDSDGGLSYYGDSLIHRSLTATASEYGNWVPLDGRYEQQLRSGRWYLGVKGSGTSNARYRLKVSTGQVVDLALDGGTVTNQNLIGSDWRYYRFTLPADSPNNWNLTFSQQVGDVNMWLRDSLPPGQGSYNGSSDSYVKSWYSDSKNQGPYSYSGQDAAGTYTFGTTQLRPGHTYYVGFRAENDATFSLSSATSGGTIGAIPVLDFYNGTLNISVPAGDSVLYRIPVPPEATRIKWTATHAATMEMRLEQGTIPDTTGSQHWTSGSSENVSFNQSLTNPNGWPWLPDQTYYLRVTNTSGIDQVMTLLMGGKNADTEDEDNDGLPDGWENQYFGYYSGSDGTGDPDGDHIPNAMEFVLGGNPTTGQDLNLLPSIALVSNPGGSVPNGEYFRFTYRRVAASASLNPGMEFSTDLAGTWTNATGAQGVVEVITPGFYAGPTTADRVDVYVPKATHALNGRLFGRLRVTTSP